MSHGENLHRTSAWATYPRSASYVCSTLYDVGRKHSCTAKNSWSPRHKNDHALCSSSP
ncbi:hypothetical protein POV87_00570 [Enterobacter roggenkampii]